MLKRSLQGTIYAILLCACLGVGLIFTFHAEKANASREYWNAPCGALTDKECFARALWGPTHFQSWPKISRELDLFKFEGGRPPVGLNLRATELACSMLLCGAGRTASASTPFAISFVSDGSSITSTGTYTFTAQNLGTADPTRTLGIGISAQSGSGFSVSTVMVGGVSATHGASCLQQNTTGEATDFWYYPDNGIAGTSANIVVTWSASITRMAISVYDITGTGNAFSTCAVNGSTSAVGTLAQSATIPSGGGAIATGTIHTATAGTVTTTNLTSDISNGLVYGSSTITAGHNTSSSGSTSMGFSWSGTTAGAALSLATFTP